MKYIENKITTKSQANRFIKELKRNKLDFHFDDCAIDCLRETDLSMKEKNSIQKRVNELFYIKDYDAYGMAIKFWKL